MCLPKSRVSTGTMGNCLKNRQLIIFIDFPNKIFLLFFLWICIDFPNKICFKDIIVKIILFGKSMQIKNVFSKKIFCSENQWFQNWFFFFHRFWQNDYCFADWMNISLFGGVWGYPHAPKYRVIDPRFVRFDQICNVWKYERTTSKNKKVRAFPVQSANDFFGLDIFAKHLPREQARPLM